MLFRSSWSSMAWLLQWSMFAMDVLDQDTYAYPICGPRASIAKRYSRDRCDAIVPFTRFDVSLPTPVWRMQQLKLLLFSMTMMLWEGMTFILAGGSDFVPMPRKERRRLLKMVWRRCKDTRTAGNRLPVLLVLPMCWMIMTNTVMIPNSKHTSSPIPPTAKHFRSQLYNFGCHTYHRVTCLDAMVELDRKSVV